MSDLVGNSEDRFSHNEAHLTDLLGELWGDSDEEVSMGDALPAAAEGCGINDMMSSSNTLQRKLKQLYTSTHF